MSYERVTLSNGRSEMAWVSEPMTDAEALSMAKLIGGGLALFILDIVLTPAVFSDLLIALFGLWFLRKAVRALGKRKGVLQAQATGEAPVFLARHAKR